MLPKRTNFNYLPYKVKLKEKARWLRTNQTKAEKHIWREFLKDHKYQFLRQKPIGNYIVDFYCSELGLVIEIDGTSHLSKEEKEYDNERTLFLKEYGLVVLRFWNDDVLSGVEIISEIIDKEIEKIIPQTPFVKGA